MGYLDATGTQTLWNNIKANFAHEIQTSSLSTNGITITLNSGAKTSGNFNQLSTALIPAATNTTGGLITNAQAQAIASIKSYTAGTGLTLSGNQFSHATGAGYNHIPTGGSSGQVLKWSSSGTAQWANEYSYTLPTASADTLGGIKVGDNLSIEDGVLSAKNGVFIGEYTGDDTDTTTYQEFLTAYNAGKHLILHRVDQYNHDAYLQLERHTSNSFVFSSIQYSNILDYTCLSNNMWGKGDWHLAKTNADNTFIETNDFQGTTTAVTQDATDNSTKLATTAFVQSAIPTALANPNALTFTGAATATYDGSSAVSVEIPDNVFIATVGTTTYTELNTAYNAGKTIIAKEVDASSSDVYWYYLVDQQWSSKNNYYWHFTFVRFNPSEHKLTYQWCSWTGTWGSATQTYVDADYLTNFTNVVNFKNTVTFTGAVTVQTPTSDSNPTTKKYVDDAIATAISGTAAYGGTVASESELLAKDYKSGMYYVVAVPSGSSWSGYENGDMFFAHTDKGTSPSLSDFDCVQTNITAMTDTEINDICTLD